eukprot:gnl/MRDRNA2_/MRDRNA2_134280_c0_seq1.p1 gnl/MRDRNA2_/MRDRNA2_134280_c0~~gnl/MRDRNA2_/MRDRNA2_134280_c0_seq1.p1  ORF type:complete len:347 (-),score=71.32 gnl/MRDRNA2_/MRDRNA2_134280_c0_seq1:391-1377(-)
MSTWHSSQGEYSDQSWKSRSGWTEKSRQRRERRCFVQAVLDSLMRLEEKQSQVLQRLDKVEVAYAKHGVGTDERWEQPWQSAETVEYLNLNWFTHIPGTTHYIEVPKFEYIEKVVEIPTLVYRERPVETFAQKENLAPTVLNSGGVIEKLIVQTAESDLKGITFMDQTSKQAPASEAEMRNQFDLMQEERDQLALKLEAAAMTAEDAMAQRLALLEDRVADYEAESSSRKISFSTSSESEHQRDIGQEGGHEATAVDSNDEKLEHRAEQSTCPKAGQCLSSCTELPSFQTIIRQQKVQRLGHATHWRQTPGLRPTNDDRRPHSSHRGR